SRPSATYSRPSATYSRPSATYSRPSATYSLSGCPFRLGPARLLGVMWETDGMAQEKRDDENRAGTEQPGDASPAATPAKKTVRRVVRQTAPQKPRVTLGRGLSSGEEQRQSQQRQSGQRQSQQRQSRQQQPRRPHRSRSSSKTKTTFSTVSAASTRLAQ